MKYIFTALLALTTLGSCFTQKKAYKICPHPLLDIGGTMFTLDTCAINLTMTEGGPNAYFAVSIVPILTDHASYSFNVHGYGEGFPVYTFLANEASGGASGNQTIHFKVSASVLHTNGKENTVYEGYILICIRVDGENDSVDQACFHLPAKITVKPKKK